MDPSAHRGHSAEHRRPHQRPRRSPLVSQGHSEKKIVSCRLIWTQILVWSDCKTPWLDSHPGPRFWLVHIITKQRQVGAIDLGTVHHVGLAVGALLSCRFGLRRFWPPLKWQNSLALRPSWSPIRILSGLVHIITKQRQVGANVLGTVHHAGLAVGALLSCRFWPGFWPPQWQNTLAS